MIVDVLITILTAAVAFLLGSIPFGVLVSRLFFGKDVRNTGSGNIGFTNSVRSIGVSGGIVVFLGDFFKGLGAAAIGMHLAPLFFTGDAPLCANAADFLVSVATLSATLGHIFCPWLGWKGGKGISTAFGASFIAMSVPAALCLFAGFLFVVFCTRYVSAGSIAAAILYPEAAVWTRLDSPLAIVLLAATGIVVIWAHRENFHRLMEGTERRIGAKRDQEEYGL